MKTLQSVSYFGNILLFYVIVVSSVRNFEFFSKYYIKTTTMTCRFNPEYAVNFTCRLKPLNWEHSIVNVELDLVRVMRNVSFQFQFFKYTNQFRPFILNKTINGCDIMKKTPSDAYIKPIFQLLTTYSNINHTCPYSGHISVKGIYGDISFIPFFIPTGVYKLVLTLYEGWPLVFMSDFEFGLTVGERTNFTRTRSSINSKSSIQ